MRFILTSAVKDLRWRLTDPFALLTWVGIPVVVLSLVSLAFGGGDGPTPTARVLVADQDDSFLSGALVGLAGQGPAAGFLDVETVTTEEGRTAMESGDATALLIIPPGFGDAVLDEQPTTLTLVTNPAQQILPVIVRDGLEILIDVAFYAQRLLGAPLRSILEGPPDGDRFFDDVTIATLSGEINARIRALDGVLIPPVLQLADETTSGDDDADAGTLNLGALFFPGVLLMSLIFIGQGISADLWREKTQGTLRRLASSPQPVSAFLVGKLLAGATMMGVVTLLGLVVGTAAFDSPMSAVPLALTWCTFAGAALLAFFLLIQALASSERGANLLAGTVVFPLIMMGGSFFPFEAMPAWMAAIGAWTPNGLAVLRLKEILSGEAVLMTLVWSGLGIGAPAVAALALASRRLTRGFITS